MADPKRLEELERQRALLDAEIARARAVAGSPSSTAAEDSGTALFDDASDEGWTAPESSPPLRKSGCWVAFSALMLVLVAAALWGIYAYYG